MAQQDFGPNDIVIHLINPYKCADCGAEFCVRSLFIEHLNEHIEKLKSESPCNQIICSTNLVEHQPNSITVTRDILQINEQQVFELQDPSLDYTQLTPLKTLEQAGILNLPPPQQSHRSSTSIVHKETPIILTVEESDVKSVGKKISLLGSQQDDSSLQLQIITDLGMKYSEPQICVQQVNEGENIPSDLESFVQQAFLVDKVKQEFNITVEAPVQNEAPSILIEGNSGEKYFDPRKAVFTVRSPKQSMTCPVCFNVFASISALERHHLSHTGVKPFPCLKCFKQFNDVSSLRKHMLIHKRQHRCPICHRMFLQRSQLSIHMKQHNKRRFIQFGNSFHEVRVEVTRNELGQQVQEYSLLILLSEEELKKVSMKASLENSDEAEAAVDGSDKSPTVNLELLPYGDALPKVEAPLEPNSADDALSKPESPACTENKKKVVYKCGHCKKLIFTRPTLSRHLIKHTNTRPFQCDLCLKTFRDKADLFHHNKTHTKPVQCNTCNMSFSKILYLQNHLQKGCPVSNNDDRFTVLENLKCQCNVCKKILKNKANVLRHLRVHAFQEAQKKTQLNNDSIPVAESCASVSQENISENVEDHYRGLENSVGFECLICGQEFRFKSFMITHVRMHLNQRPYKCEVCSKCFFTQHILKKHMQNHTRPYKCPACDKGFIRRYLMKDHFKKRHEQDLMKDITELHDEKKLQCDICGKTMKSYQKSLMQHHVRQHKDVRPFACEVCQKAFTSDTALKKHSLNHTKPYKCQVCGQGFSRRYLLTDHFKKKCARKKEDKIVTSSESAPESNTKIADSNNFSSEVKVISQGVPSEQLNADSSIQGSLIMKMSDSSGVSTYMCRPCNKKFTVYDALLRHVNTFSKPTACKYCGTVFDDKHLAVAHQRSCLGISIDPSKMAKRTSNTQKNMGEQQEKIQKIMKDISEKIEQLSATPNNEQDKREAVLSNSHNLEDESPVTPLDENTQKELNLSPLSKTFTEENGKYQCPECEKSFTSLRGMKIHASSHVRLFKCEGCGKDFTNIVHLRAHAKTHRDPQAAGVEEHKQPSAPEKATECDKSISNEGADGQNIMNNKSKHSSPLVSKSHTPLKKKRKTNVEVDSDADESPELKLTSKNILEVNQRLMCSGTRGRPFSCKMCRRRFTEAVGLESHILQIHGVKS
ncbi:hypothetical protein Btru_043641 [Bulinus truncatus]|nr:hypothetical protein Btru_043641 [Bulinus truncatus]